jgi:hypothetical protein
MDVTEKGEASSRTRLAGRGHRLIVPSKYQMELKPGPDFPLGLGRAETRELRNVLLVVTALLAAGCCEPLRRARDVCAGAAAGGDVLARHLCARGFRRLHVRTRTRVRK